MDENVAEMASRDQLDRNLAGSSAMRHGARLSATCGHFGISAFRHSSKKCRRGRVFFADLAQRVYEYDTSSDKSLNKSSTDFA